LPSYFYKFWDAENNRKIYRKLTALCDLSTDWLMSVESHKQSLRKTCVHVHVFVCWQHAAVINLGAARILNSVTFAPAIGHSTNECMKQWKGEIYSDAWSLERTPVDSTWPIADVSIVHTSQEALHVHFSALCASRYNGNKNKTYQWRSRDI